MGARVSRLLVVCVVVGAVLLTSGCARGASADSDTPLVSGTPTPTAVASTPTAAQPYAPGPTCPADYVATVAPSGSVEQPTAPPPEPREFDILGPASCEAQFELPASVALADPSRWTGAGPVPVRLIAHELVGDQPFGAFRNALVAAGYTVVFDDEAAYRSDATHLARWTLQLDGGSTILQAVYYPAGAGTPPRAVVISVDLDGG